MAKDNLFEQDLNLQGIAKIINLRLDALTSLDSSSPIYDKVGGAYFNTLEDSIRVKTADGWYSTVLYNGGLDENQVLCVFKPNEYNKVERFITREVAPRLLAIDVDSSPYLVEFVNFTNFLDPDIFVDAVINNDTRLVTSNAVYDYVASAISGLTGDYLPLAGGIMSGNIVMQDNYIVFNSEIDRNPVNIYAANNPISMFDSNLNIELNSGYKQNYINVTSDLGETDGELHIFPCGIVPINISPAVSYLGDAEHYFGYGYITNLYSTRVSGNGELLTLIGGKYDDTRIEIGGNQVTFYDSIYPSTTVTKDMGSGSTRWRNGYFSNLYTFQLYVNSTTAYVDEIVTTIDLVSPSNHAIATEGAVARLFGTIETITGVAITDMETVGMVTRFSGSNPENYYLAADDSWRSLTWVVDGTTLGLNSSLGITDFEFIADTTVAFGVNGRYTQLTHLDDGNITLYLGEIGSSILTDHTNYIIEIIGDMRTTSNILLGGTLSTSAVVALNSGTISAVPVLTVSTAIDCEGISTDGTNIWKLLDAVTGTSITPSDLLVVTVNGVYYKIVAQEFTPAT